PRKCWRTTISTTLRVSPNRCSSSIAIRCPHFKFSPKRAKNRTRSRPSPGARRSRACSRTASTATSTLPRPRCVSVSSTPRAKRSSASRLTTAIRPIIMSSPAGARAQGDDGAQQEHFAAALRQEPNNELYQFNLAVLQIKSGDKDKIDNARATLTRLTKTAPFRTGALRALLNDAIDRADLNAADEIAQELQMSPQVTFGDYLLCLNLYRKLDQKKFDLLLDKVKPVAARLPNDAALLMDWMNNNGLAADVLKWMEKLPSNLTTNPPAAISIAESFATVRNWSRLK